MTFGKSHFPELQHRYTLRPPLLPGAWWDNPTMILTLDAKRRLTLPRSLAPASPGDAFEARFDADKNEIVFRRLAGVGDWLAVLSECPVKLEDLPRRRKESAKRRRL